MITIDNCKKNCQKHAHKRYVSGKQTQTVSESQQRHQGFAKKKQGSVTKGDQKMHLSQDYKGIGVYARLLLSNL